MCNVCITFTIRKKGNFHIGPYKSISWKMTNFKFQLIEQNKTRMYYDRNTEILVMSALL